MALFEPQLQKLQALRMIDLKVSKGMTKVQIAKEMGVSTDTVDRRLAMAKKAGLYVTYEDQILNGLVPKAISAIAEALDDGDSETGQEVLKNILPFFYSFIFPPCPTWSSRTESSFEMPSSPIVTP